MSKTPPTFAERLRTLRAAAGLSQGQLAKLIGTAQANPSPGWEHSCPGFSLFSGS